MAEDEIIGWFQQLNKHEFEQGPGDGEGQGSLACWSPWGRQESDVAERVSLVAQLVKNLPAMQETPVRFLGQEDPLENR